MSFPRRDIGSNISIGAALFPDLAAAISGTRWERFRFVVLLLFLFLCVIGGGGSRPDIASLLYLRPAAVICIAALLLSPGPWDFRTFRWLFLLLGLFAATMLIQIIPLPPGLWQSLPGHERYVEAAEAAGLAQPWRPISLAPDLTLNSMLALLPPFAVLVGLAAIRSDQRRALLPFLIVVALLSAVLAIAQFASGPRGGLYFYQVTHEGSGVGFFANRNHQAALLAMTFPMLRLWSLGGRHERTELRRLRLWFAIAAGCFLLPTILVIGSRAGAALALIGLLSIFVVAPPRLPSSDSRMKRAAPLAALVAVPFLLGMLVLAFGRAETIDRLVKLAQDQSNESRISNIPLMLRMTSDFLPWGSGFGSFDPLFRGYEPDHILKPTYFNHAHNELIELALTGGVAALLVLAGFLVWTIASAWTAFRPFGNRSRTILLGRVGTVMVLIVFMASLVDYPLRTPLLGTVFTIACGWLAAGRAATQPDAG